jgi:hypothetical protein
MSATASIFSLDLARLRSMLGQRAHQEFVERLPAVREKYKNELPFSLVHAQHKMGARERLLVVEGKTLVGGTFVCHCDCDGRRRCRNEMRQREPDDTRSKENCGYAFEQMPTIKAEHRSLSQVCVSRHPVSSLCEP